MWSRSDLLINHLPGIADPLFDEVRNRMADIAWSQDHDLYRKFIDRFQNYILSSTLIRLPGLDKMQHQDVMIGCNHFIDNLIIKYGLGNLQIFEHDYKYYHRLKPDITFAKIGSLRNDRPVLIAAPFPGCLDLHWHWHALLDECDAKQIPVHIDGAWLGLARDIEIDLTRNCIRSIGLSLSKGLGLSWNRIGVRWSKDADAVDSIKIMNQFFMIPETLIRVGLMALDIVPIDYLWNKYQQRYQSICKELKLRPTKIINAAMSIDRRELYGLAKLL